MKLIDISNLTGLTTSLRIEGLQDLDTLNIQNGSVTEQFSLFYTENTKFACVDSISSEYDTFGVFGAMMPGLLPSVNCGSVGVNENDFPENSIHLFPNPTSGILSIESESPIEKVTLFSPLGEMIYNSKNTNSLDLSSFPAGIYFLDVHTENKKTTQRIVVR